MSTSMDISACLMWSVEKPNGDISRKSPTFSYLGIEWYLYLGNYCNKNNKCILEVCTKDSKEFNKTFKLTVFISYITHECVGGESIDIRNKSSYNSIVIDILNLQDNGKWIVYCIFSSDLPSELHITEKDTMQVRSNLIVRSELSDLVDERNLSTDFSKLLEQQSTSDVTLTCGDRTFSAHRIILAARSEVFEAMFQSKMIESETGRIDIKDIDGEVFELLLKYVYTEKLPDLSVDTASSLYIAADKYSIQSLKNTCIKWILGNVTKENCLDFLLVAVTWNDTILKDRLVNFVANSLHLLERDEWQKFSDKFPIVANSVYHKRVFT